MEEFCKKDKAERFSTLYKWTCEQKYGKEYFKEHAAKGRETKEEHYGKDFDKLMMQKAKEKGLENDPNMAEHNAEKARETKLEKYGKEKLKKIAKETYKKAAKTKLKKYGKDYFKLQAKENFPKVAKTKLERYGTLFPRDEAKASKGEKQVVDFVKSIYSKTVFENYAGLGLKNGKEVDIYIPEKTSQLNTMVGTFIQRQTEYTELVWRITIKRSKNFLRIIDKKKLWNANKKVFDFYIF